MKKRHIKQLLKLEKEMNKELSDLYAECMMSMFPMFDNVDKTVPNKRVMIREMEKRFFEKYPELGSLKLISFLISKYVSKKYEVIR